MNKLFNWMPGSAYAEDGSSFELLADSTRAGEIATSLTQYFGDQKDAFIDIGDDKLALGELNGELARTLAAAIGPPYRCNGRGQIPRCSTRTGSLKST